MGIRMRRSNIPTISITSRTLASAQELEKMVKLTRGGSLANFLPHPIFARCVKDGFVKPLAELSGGLIGEAVTYISTTIRCLPELDPSSDRRRSPVIEGMSGVGIQLRRIILQETLEFIKVREAACRAHLETRSKAEGFIFTLDSTYGKAIEDLKHDGDRGNDQSWTFLRQGKLQQLMLASCLACTYCTALITAVQHVVHTYSSHSSEQLTCDVQTYCSHYLERTSGCSLAFLMVLWASSSLATMRPRPCASYR